MSTLQRRGAVAGAVLAMIGALGGVGLLAWNKLNEPVPVYFASAEEHFKYGSFGNVATQGLPYYVWMVLPRVFGEYLPGNGGYASFGFVSEPGREVPVGFAKQTIGVPRISFNCAMCHASSYRLGPRDNPVIAPGGPAHQSDTQAYLQFLFACASDPRFNADVLLREIQQNVDLSAPEELLYRQLLIPATKKALLEQKAQSTWMDLRPKWGPGRIDPFNPVKYGLLEMPVDGTLGNADNMSIWQLSSRKGQRYHWDGMNDSLREVLLSSAFGDGASQETIDLSALERLERWLVDVRPPKFPDAIETGLAARGHVVFQRLCHDCHGSGGARTGGVIPVAEIGTDPHRNKLWTADAARRYNAYADGYDYDFSHFRGTNGAQDGYASTPLTGIWLRAPYLHNGSVPSLWDLLSEPYGAALPAELGEVGTEVAQLSRRALRNEVEALRRVEALVRKARADERRPPLFFRGYDVVDRVNVGFVADIGILEEDAQPFLFDTRLAGNAASGHRGERYGTTLPRDDKLALIEYLKTL